MKYEYSTKLIVLLSLVFATISTLQIQAIIPNNSSKPQNSTIDPYKYLHIIPNSNGSITRIKEYFPTVPPNTSSSLSFSKDVPLNPNKGTWVRVYLPNKSKPANLPIIVYAHGGGFIVLSTATPNFDHFLANTASQLGVLVVSVEYRLAPEHRLPAANDDVLEALYWIRDKKDKWITEYGDITKCIIMGESAGGNIAYHVGLRASSIVHVLKPLILKGLVLIQPFFGGVHRSRTEFWSGNNTGGLSLPVTDLMWNLSLPLGANRNHPYCNPIIKGRSSSLDRIKKMGWRVAIAGCDGDLLFDRQVKLFELLHKRGVNVMGNFSKGDYHGVFVTEDDKAHKLFEFVKHVFSSYLSF